MVLVPIFHWNAFTIRDRRAASMFYDKAILVSRSQTARNNNTPTKYFIICTCSEANSMFPMPTYASSNHNIFTWLWTTSESTFPVRGGLWSCSWLPVPTRKTHILKRQHRAYVDIYLFLCPIKGRSWFNVQTQRDRTDIYIYNIELNYVMDLPVGVECSIWSWDRYRTCGANCARSVFGAKRVSVFFCVCQGFANVYLIDTYIMIVLLCILLRPLCWSAPHQQGDMHIRRSRGHDRRDKMFGRERARVWFCSSPSILLLVR